jgi:GAG-pre-integrase domain
MDQGKDKKGARFFYDHCNRSVHSKERCYVLHPHLKPSRNRSNEANMTATFENDGIQHKLEHITKQVDFLMKKCITDSELANAGPSGESHVAQHTGNVFALSTFFLKIIINSRATDNMFTSSELLTKFQPGISYSHVTVANSPVIPTKGTGIARIFSKDIGITVVPNLKTNLLSISKCTNQLGCNILFTFQKAVFQDRNSGRTISEDSMVNGLYVLELDQLALSTVNTASSQLWHKRLGHPSDRVLKHLSLSLTHDFNNFEPCQFAQLHRL